MLNRIELPLDKLDKLRKLALDYMHRPQVTKRELQVLTGHMAFTARAITGARPFTCLFHSPSLSAVNTLKESHYKFHFAPLHLAELKWWAEFTGSFNGLCPCTM